MTETTTASTPPRTAKRWITTACVIIVLLFAAIAVLMPTMCGSRETANRVKCGANLKQIGSALHDYANAHDGHYPDTLEQLVLANPDLPKTAFVCPSSNDEAATGNTPADVAASFSQPHHLSYLYLGKGLTTSAKDDTPLMAEPLDNHDNDGASILFTDGHVDFCTKDAAKHILGVKLADRR